MATKRPYLEQQFLNDAIPKRGDNGASMGGDTGMPLGSGGGGMGGNSNTPGSAANPYTSLDNVLGGGSAASASGANSGAAPAKGAGFQQQGYFDASGFVNPDTLLAANKGHQNTLTPAQGGQYGTGKNAPDEATSSTNGGPGSQYQYTPSGGYSGGYAQLDQFLSNASAPQSSEPNNTGQGSRGASSNSAPPPGFSPPQLDGSPAGPDYQNKKKNQAGG